MREFTNDELKVVAEYATVHKHCGIFIHSTKDLPSDEKRELYINAFKNSTIRFHHLSSAFPNEDFSELALEYDYYNTIYHLLFSQRRRKAISSDDLVKYFTHPGLKRETADNRFYVARNLLFMCPNPSGDSLKIMFEHYVSTRIRSLVLEQDNCPRHCFERACQSKDKKVIYAAIKSDKLPEDLLEPLVRNWLKIFPEDCRSYFFKEQRFPDKVKDRIEYLRQVVDILE
jgi:hypothetical protein